MRRRDLAALAGFLPLAMLAACADPRELDDMPPRVIFFTEDSAELDDTAKGIVANAARLARRHPTAPVRVLGFADPDGGPALNRALSAARAEAVVNALVADGVARPRIQQAARGPVPFAMVPTESRRVEVYVGPVPRT